MLDTVDFNHVQHISFTQSLLTDAVSVILSELLSYEHPPNAAGALSYLLPKGICLFIMWSRSRSQLIQLNRPAGSPSSSVPAAVSI